MIPLLHWSPPLPPQGLCTCCPPSVPVFLQTRSWHLPHPGVAPTPASTRVWKWRPAAGPVSVTVWLPGCGAVPASVLCGWLGSSPGAGEPIVVKSEQCPGCGRPCPASLSTVGSRVAWGTAVLRRWGAAVSLGPCRGVCVLLTGQPCFVPGELTTTCPCPAGALLRACSRHSAGRSSRPEPRGEPSRPGVLPHLRRCPGVRPRVTSTP